MRSLEARPWEHGSELTLPWAVPQEPPDAGPSYPWTEARLYGSGRDALRALLRHGNRQHGWRRLWVPSYLCQEVAGAARLEIPLEVYEDRPSMVNATGFLTEVRDGDVVYRVNTFGLRDVSWKIDSDVVTVIEDHTHDPWSPWAASSSADFALASLRKTLPLPDGGALWSPRGLMLPPPLPVTAARQRSAEAKFAGQTLKALYLAGCPMDKETFRQLCIKGEEDIASGDPSGMSDIARALLEAFPTHTWREQRRANFELVAGQLRLPHDYALLSPASGACAFALVLRCPSRSARDSLRRALIGNGVYPAVLWPLDNPIADPIEAAAVELSERLLSLHCDYRYDAAHMNRLASIMADELGVE